MLSHLFFFCFAILHKMSSSQNADDSSLSNIDTTPDYQAQLDQLLQEARMGLSRLNHNIARFNDSLQTIAQVGEQFAGTVNLWKSFHMSIKTPISDDMLKRDAPDKNPGSEHLSFEQSMLEKEPEEDEKRENSQQQFVHGTMNETVVLDSLSSDDS